MAIASPGPALSSTVSFARSAGYDAQSEEITTLGIYFRQMAAVSVMTSEEEHAAAERIVACRANYWDALLSYPAFTPAILRVLERTLPDESRPQRAIEVLESASRKVRDRQTRANADRFARAARDLAELLSRIDTDGDASEPISADLQSILDGQRQLAVLEVTFPPAGSEPYRRYVERTRHAGAALWRAKHKFVRANLRLVVTMARRYARGGMPLSDLIQEGNIGLLKAVDRFDPSRGFRFSTYASWWIRHAISRALADKGREVRVPVHMIDVHHKLKRTRRRFETEWGREPTDEELSEAAAVPMEKIARMRTCLMDQGPSLDSPIASGGAGDSRTLGDLLEDDSLPQAPEFLQSTALGHRVREALAVLRPIEADVLRKRFGLDEGEPMTLREIGQEYSLSRERIRQLQEQALGKIRRELRRHDLI